MPVSIWDTEAYAHYGATPPIEPRPGQVWVDNSALPALDLKVFDGNTWVTVNSSGVGGAVLPTPNREGEFLIANSTGSWAPGNADAGRY